MGKLSIFSLISVFITIIIWALATPIFEFPDEQAHFESVEFLAKEGRMPAGDEWDMTQEMKTTQDRLGIFRDPYGNNLVTYHPEYHPEYGDNLMGRYEEEIKSLNTSENRDTYVWKEAARYPRLYYDYLAFWDKLVSGQDIITRVFVLRFGNVMLALLTALFVYKAGMEIFEKAVYARTLTLLVMLQPMYSFLSAGINSDNLHNMLFASIIYVGLHLLKHKLSVRLVALAAIVVALDIYTKPQGFVALPILFAAVTAQSIVVKNWKLLASLVGLAIVGVVVVLNPSNPYASWFNTANVHNASLVEFVRFSLNKLVAQNIVWYWGVFKWLGVVLPPIYWQVANRVVMVAALGLLIYFVKAKLHKKLIVAPLTVCYLILVVGIYTLSIYWFDWQYNKAVGYSIGVQARYLFPTIVAQMALLITGITAFAGNVKFRRYLRSALVLMFVWLQIGALWRLLSSYYDLSSLSTLISQISQYKPDFAKGNWWYLWGVGYIVSVLYLTYLAIFPARHPRPSSLNKVKHEQT